MYVRKMQADEICSMKKSCFVYHQCLVVQFLFFSLNNGYDSLRDYGRNANSVLQNS